MALSALDLPAGCVTGVGSLPMTDPEEAIRLVAETCPEVPFWPQLPRRSVAEGICDQALGDVADLLMPRLGPPEGPPVQGSGRAGGLWRRGSDRVRGAAPSRRPARGKGAPEGAPQPPSPTLPRGFLVNPGQTDAVAGRLAGGPAALDPDHVSGLFALDRAFTAGRFPKAVAVKGQTVGPVTLALYLFDGAESFARYEDLTEAVAARVSQTALSQVERLKRLGRPVILVVDEPGLGFVGKEILRRPAGHLLAALAGVIGAIRRSGAAAGLHCCAEFPFAILDRVRPDILSFDAHHGLEGFLADRNARKFLQSGGWVAWGLIPTLPDLGHLKADTIFERWRRAVGRAGRRLDPQSLARRSIVTASCGLGTLDVEAARASLALARAVSRLMVR